MLLFDVAVYKNNAFLIFNIHLQQFVDINSFFQDASLTHVTKYYLIQTFETFAILQFLRCNVSQICFL